MSSSNTNSDHQMQAGNQNVPSQSNIVNQPDGSAVLYGVQGSRPPQAQNFSKSDSGEGAMQPYVQQISVPYSQAQNHSIHSNSLGPLKDPLFSRSQEQINSYVASSSAKFSSGEPLRDAANSDMTNPISVQNGPYPVAISSEQLPSSFPSWNVSTNSKVNTPILLSSGSLHINGVSSNRSNFPPPTTEISPSLQRPSHIKIPPPPGTTVISNQYGSNPVPSFQTGRNFGAQQQPPLPAVDGKIVPNPSSVPSSFGVTGLPMPYSSQGVKSSSPQITPGTSQPPSARSSRNPSPIASHRYDYMEGQFSNKPSPSNSFANLQNLNHNPGPLNSNYPAIVSSANSYSPMPPITSPTSQLGLPAKPGPSITKQMTVTSQPVQNTIHNTIPVSAVSAPTRPRYPNQVGYNCSMPVVNQPLTSQPSSTQYSPMHNSSQLNQQSGFNSPQLNQQSGYNSSQLNQEIGFNSPQLNQQSGFNSSQLNQQSGFNSSQLNQQTGYPEGPVGGVSGYDPHLHGKMAGMSIHSSFSRLWGNDSINLLQDRNILPAIPIEAPKPVLPQDKPNCSPKIFRSTLTKVPETSSLLQKSRLPFGVLIHPFRDVSNLPVVHCNTIVRCRNCRTYINAFVVFVDLRRWKCNLCFRINDLPEEFLYDPITRSYGDPSRRPEIRNATIEFIAPSDYMLRPPQPAVYLFLLDVSHGASETGYLQVFCDVMLNNLDHLPGDSRTRIGFITFNGSIHFYNLGEGLNQPHMLIVSDIEDVFLPSPDNLLVNLHESKSLIQDLLKDLPQRFAGSGDTNNCLGAALQAAYKLMAPTGGRIAVVQTGLPNIGPGALKNREDPNQRAAKEVTNIGPASDFYKKLALDCSTQQVGVDLFLLCSQYADVATLSCISKFSSGCVQYYPGFHVQVGKLQVEKFGNDLKRYFTRRIGLEAVMRIRCTKGLTIHTFHGNFFVRSTDLLSLPNVSPDAGFAMQIAIEDNLTEINSVCFQAAVLYTATHGERRIRVHTLCLPVVSILQDILGGADQEAIIGLVSKMAVDRSITASLGDARDALINVCIDILGVFKQTLQANQTAGMLMAPFSTRLVPLFILALLKNVAFRTGVSTKLDERVFAMERMKTLPLQYLMKFIYPMMYPVHALDDKNAIHLDDSIIPQPPILHLSSEKIDRHGAYLLDTIDAIYLFVGRAVSDHFCVNILGVPNFSAIPEELLTLPLLTTPDSERLRNFISWLQSDRPAVSPFKVIREDGKDRNCFLQYMLDDRTESLFSYYEFLQHVRQQISK